MCGGAWVSKKLPDRINGRKPVLTHITVCAKCGNRPWPVNVWPNAPHEPCGAKNQDA